MSILNQLAADALIFVADFGEQVLYTPYQGVAYNITAIVDRNPPTSVGELIGGRSIKYELFIANDSTNTVGVSTTTISVGKDTVAVADRIGGSVKTITVMKIIQNDQGIVHVAAG